MKYLVTVILLAFCLNGNGQNVKLVQDDAKQKVDVTIGGKLFTSYCYPSDLEKPFLYPVYAPNGSVITRGFPIAPREGERVDHPHHIGIWFNHGNINGLDFWNNSSAIPASRKASYGHIVHQKIVQAKSGKTGTLKVITNWDDNDGNTLLKEDVTYIFSGDKNSFTVDHISTLTAVNGTVTIGETKEGMFAIRTDRAFEMPSNESLIFTDANGNPTTVKASNNSDVTTGMYTSSKGLKGNDVWGTRNDWVVLTGKKDNTVISFGMFDNPKNPGYPAYAHARGYGLFSINNLGQNSYDKTQKEISYKLEKGESIKLSHRFVVQSGSEITADEANKIFQDFAKK